MMLQHVVQIAEQGNLVPAYHSNYFGYPFVKFGTDIDRLATAGRGRGITDEQVLVILPPSFCGGGYPLWEILPVAAVRRLSRSHR